MPAVFDQAGNFLGNAETLVEEPPSSAPAPQPSQHIAWGNIGGSIWEFFHPYQVQEEYRAVGKEPPSLLNIMTTAADDVQEQAAEQAKKALKFSTTGLVVVGVAFLMLKAMEFQQRQRRVR